MTDDELNRIAEKLAEKLQSEIVSSIYRDAGRSLLGSFKHVLWAAVIAVAAWGAAKGGVGQ